MTPASTVPQLINQKQLTHLINLSRTTIYRMVKQNRFPKPIKVGLNAVRWDLVDIMLWMEERKLSNV